MIRFQLAILRSPEYSVKYKTKKILALVRILGASKINIFTKRLKQARERLGLSQKQLGIKAGFDESSASARMNQYERGKHRPDANTIERLCKVLKVPVAYLYCEDDQLARVIISFSRLASADKKKVLKLVEKVESV